MSRVVAVVGGGISGLAAARVLAGCEPVGGQNGGLRDIDSLRNLGHAPEVEVLVLEADERLGGKILSGEFRGRSIDFGPDNFLTRDPSAAELCRLVGLGEDLVAPATGSASVLARGRLRPLPAGLVLGIPTDFQALARSGIVSVPGIARAALDLLGRGAPIPASSVGLRPDDGAIGGRARSRDPEGPEWNAASILERRLGREVVERLVDPLLGGINAGSTDQLSLAVIAPQVAKQLVGQRSVMRALAALAPRQPAPRSLEGTTSLFLGLRGGLGTLVEALVACLEDRAVSLRTRTPVSALRQAGGRYELETPGGTIVADGVVLASPAYSSALMLADSLPRAAAELGSIPYAPVVLVTLAWPASSISPLPNASGFLVPRRERRLLTACTILSAKWPRAAASGEVVLRASTGRYGDERSSSMSDEELLARVTGELRELVGASGPPLATAVKRWPRAFPQYLPGHLRRIERAQAALREVPRLELAGAALGGIGIPACVTSGERAAVSVLSRLSE